MAEDGAKKPSDHLYWARTQSTTAPVEHKPLDKDAAAALMQAASAKPGAVWNAASTWEEKDISNWARELMSETLLPAVQASFELPPREAAALNAELAGAASVQIELRVVSVTSAMGDVTHVLSRGKQRVMFELGLKLKLEVVVRADGETKQILVGILNIMEVSSARKPRRSFPRCRSPSALIATHARPDR